MADVIPLAPLRRTRAAACAAPRQSAEILFFTGVRYERAVEPRQPEHAGRRAAATKAAPAKPAGRRKARQPA